MNKLIIKGDLILTEDTTFEDSIIVEGDIRGYYNLKVAGNIDARNINAGNIDARNIDARNIDAWNIDARNIDAWNIDAWNIDAWNINAGNIDAWNIDAGNIICETRVKKTRTSKTKCRIYIKNKSKIDYKEQDD